MLEPFDVAPRLAALIAHFDDLNRAHEAVLKAQRQVALLQPLVSVERRDLALAVGRFGRAAGLYNLLSQCEDFGLGEEEARSLIDGMLAVVRGWREFFTERGVDAMGIKMLEQAMLPECFFRREPPEAV